jgi:RNA polymerase sigma-70 factor (ECF subfamily)
MVTAALHLPPGYPDLHTASQGLSAFVDRGIRFLETESKPVAKTTLMERDNKLGDKMAAAQMGDAGAYRAVLRDCLPLIAAMARAQGMKGAEIDDVVQDVLMTVHRVRETYDPARPFMPWLKAITQRRVIDRMRRQGRRPHEVHDPIAYETQPDSAARPDRGFEERDRRRSLAAAVAALPEGQREAVEHLGLQERSLQETAVLTGRSIGTLKVSFHRALKAMRVQLSNSESHDDV